MLKEVGDLLRGARNQRGLRQAEVALALGRSQSWYNNIEGSNYPLAYELMIDLAKILDIDPVDLAEARSREELSDARADRGDIERWSEARVVAQFRQRHGQLPAQGATLKDVNPLSSRQIRERAAGLLKLLYGHDHASWGNPPELGPIMERLGAGDPTIAEAIVGPGERLEVSVYDEPGEWSEGRVCWKDGGFHLQLRADVHHRLMTGQPRSRFTLCHEIAHLVLHGDKLRAMSGVAHRDAFSGTKQTRDKAYLDPEWQASTFAAAFLVSDEALIAYLQRQSAQEDVPTTRIAEHFKVSNTVAAIRLSQVVPLLVKGGGAV